jgi:hypothetical protein
LENAVFADKTHAILLMVTGGGRDYRQVFQVDEVPYFHLKEDFHRQYRWNSFGVETTR